MKALRTLILTAGIAALSATSFAGHVVATDGKDSKGTVEAPYRAIFPDFPPGNVTVGVQFSEHLTGAYLDSITGLWAPKTQDAFLFLNSRYHLEDDGQFISSTGLGFRKLFAEQEIIVGINGYWDSLHSARDNDFNQLGLGAEILTHWVDARFNYYLPEDDQYEVDRHTTTDTHRTGAGFFGREVTRKRTYKTYEAALEGFNAEVGFLIPGLCKYTEVRLFGGFYHYDNPFGSDFTGFKARLEARLLPGVIADLEYWDDAALMGGHWTAGLRASVPFSVYNLVTGRNPFAGIGDYFTPREREFNERLGDQVIRSHRIQTTESSPELVSDTTESHPLRPFGRGFRGGIGGAGGVLLGGNGLPLE